MTNLDTIPQNSETLDNHKSSSDKKLYILIYLLATLVLLLTIAVLSLFKSMSSIQNNPEVRQQFESPVTTTTPPTQTTQKKTYDDGVYSFTIPEELYLFKDPANPGVPYAQLKTIIDSTIQIDISSELELSCIEIDRTEVIEIAGHSLEKVYYRGMQNSDLPNCVTDNSSFRAIWMRLPKEIENRGRPTLAIRYDSIHGEQALKIYDEILSTLKF